MKVMASDMDGHSTIVTIQACAGTSASKTDTSKSCHEFNRLVDQGESMDFGQPNKNKLPKYHRCLIR